MNENYYDILEVNKNASQEIIEKASKIVVKKYHPDLQENNLKNKFEEKIKKINEAYDILSDLEKRKNYDLFLNKNEISIENYNKLYNENIILKKQLNDLNTELFNLKNNIYNKKNNYAKNYTNDNFYNFNSEKTNDNYYNNSNKNNLNNKTNSINYFFNYFLNILKKIIKNFFAIFLTILFIIIICFILWHIPFTKNYFINLYNENIFIKNIINFFI